MKSVKTQYIALKEGKMTEAQFMRNVRMTLPQYISNVTLFKQAERILINKGIISEIKAPIVEVLNSSDEAELEKIVAKYVKDADDIEKEMDAYSQKGFRGFSDLVQANLDRDDEFKSWVQRTSDEEQLSKETSESLNEVKDDSKTGYYNQDGKEQYSKFDELDNMNAQEVMAGYVMEKIDNPNIDQKEAIKLVIKNLKTDQFYYTNYKLTGIRGLKPTEFTSTKPKPGADQTEEVSKKGDNLKDTKNAEKVIKEGLNEVATDDIFSKWRELSDDEKEQIAKFIKTTGDRDAKKQAEKVASQFKSKDLNEEENNVMDIADEIYDELQALGSYNDNDVAKLIATYPNLSGDEKKEIEVIIFDRDREEMMNESIISESQKAKLKELVRKMMKEMLPGDGRDNVDAVEDTSSTDIVNALDGAKLIKKYYAPVEKPDEKFLLSTLYANGEAMIKNVGSTNYYDYPGSFMKDLRSGKIKEVPFY